MRHVSELKYRKLYRARDGRLLGVCKGLARYLEVPVFWVRVGVVFLAVFSGVWPVIGGYLLAGFLLRPEPVLAPGNDDERDFYSRFAANKKNGREELTRRFERLSRRIRRMEDVVTSKEYDWERRFRGK
ncbi:envelope stress response membrane protein PspC [Desulfolutivibrio sp.]|uniref:envelope stress response membrane protein PspC n=1 Tax=Desulfolutivibrio sp. TaxID=2773296 RepID=UPI002F96E887